MRVRAESGVRNAECRTNAAGGASPFRIPQSATCNQNGFTLLELIVVVAVFGVFAAMAYGGLNYVLTARKTLEVSLDRTAEWQKAFQRVRNDLELVTPRAARDGFGQPQPAFLFEEFGARIEFTRSGWRNPLSLPRPSLERVVYRFDERKRELLRETWRVLDRADDNEPLQLVVLSGVDDARWRFMDRSRTWQERWPPQSTTTNSSTANTLIPLAIELTLESKDFGEVVWLLRPSVQPAVQTGGSTGGTTTGGTTGSTTGGTTGTGSGGEGGGPNNGGSGSGTGGTGSGGSAGGSPGVIGDPQGQR